MRLLTIVGSTRPGRIGPAVAHWVAGTARADARFVSVQVVDLAELALPFLDEPELPRLRRYAHAHTHRWSELVEEHDAFLVVTPEYNLAPPPSLLNALDFLHHEWRWKAAAVVAYGGVAGGARAGQVVKQVLGAMNCFTVHEGVVLVGVHEHLDEAGALVPPPGAGVAAEVMLASLATLASALGTVRPTS